MTTDEIASVLDRVAPSSLAESWDNPGWQVRIPSARVTGILLTLEATEAALEEAVGLGFNLLFTHHPAIFKPAASLDLGKPLDALLGQTMRREISIWSAHTNLDVMPHGTSYAMAVALGLTGPRLLSQVDRHDFKLVVYAPASHSDALKEALAEAGAGRIGDYSACFWQVLGEGQFRPEEGANPYLGGVGRLERVEELRVEGVVPRSRLGEVLDAMRRAHPYEEIAYDLIPLANRVSGYGYGSVGRLVTPLSTADVARKSAATLSSAVCQVAGRSDRLHDTVAVVGGSGTSFIGDAVRSGATLFITADVRYHDAQDAVARGLDLVVLDHYATERPVLELIQAQLKQLLPDTPVQVSTTPSTPYVRIEP